MPTRRTFLALGLSATVAGAVTAPADLAAAAPTGRPATRAAWIRTTLRAMSLEQKVGQLFVPYVTGSRADEADPENTARFGVATPAEAVAKFHLGGVIYFAWSRNVNDPEQIARLSNDLQRTALGPDRSPARVPLSVATDQETGLVARVGPPATVFPGAMALGASRNTRATYDTYAITARELRALGINTDYAPDADVNVNPANPVIGVRSFSSDPSIVAQHVPAAIAGLQDHQVSSSAKHFPGHGDTGSDSHTSLPVITHTRAEWERIDAPPFRAAIAGGVDAIMTAHISFPAFDDSGDPSTLSTAVLTGLLREELGFDGVIATDSLRMEGVRKLYSDAEIPVRALLAGADVLLDPQQPTVQIPAVVAAVRAGRLSESRIDESVTRILGLKWDRGVVADPYVKLNRIDAVVGTRRHLDRAQQITDQTTTLVTDDAGLVPLPAGRVLVTGTGDAQVAQLATGLRARGRFADPMPTGASPSAATVQQVAKAAADHDLVLVTTSAAWKSTAQQQLVAALVATGTPVMVVALRDPYDIAALPGVRSYVATYSSTTPAVESVLRVITGEKPARGRLPVDIPVAPTSTEILHAIGTGLSS